MEETETLHTEEDCWAEFWDRATTVVADLVKGGWQPEVQEAAA